MPFPYTFPFNFDTEDFTVRIAFASDPFGENLRWTDIGNVVLSGSIARGRQHELDRIEAGTCRLLVKNTAGDFWPDNASGKYYGNLKPGKRINIRKTYNGTDYDLFTGFIESYQPRFLARAGVAPVVDITAVDLFKHLALTTLNDRVADFDGTDAFYVSYNNDMSGQNTDFTVAAWVWCDALGANSDFVSKHMNTAWPSPREYRLRRNSSNQFVMTVAAYTTEAEVAAATAVTANTWYHLIGYYNTSNNTVSIVVNNSSPDEAAGIAPIKYNGDVHIGRANESSGYHNGRIASVGFWRRLLSADERRSLYNQGRRIMYADLSDNLKTNLVAWWNLDEESGTRYDAHAGYDLYDVNTVASISQYESERSDLRVGRILDAIGWPSGNRDLGTGAATLQALTPVDGVVALSHLQSLAQSENGLVFIAGDGDVQFQNRTARANSPFDTSQATFGDDAGEMKYRETELSYDDQFIYNDVRLTRNSGTEQVAGDADSQITYGKRTLSRTGLLQSTDADVLTVAEALRDTYKDPSLRVESIVVIPSSDPSNLWPKVLNYDISTRITVRLNEASLDSEFHIEGIQHTFSRDSNWQTAWQLSKAS